MIYVITYDDVNNKYILFSSDISNFSGSSFLRFIIILNKYFKRNIILVIKINNVNALNMNIFYSFYKYNDKILNFQVYVEQFIYEFISFHVFLWFNPSEVKYVIKKFI
jgi:hypothetical protein